MQVDERVLEAPGTSNEDNVDTMAGRQGEAGMPQLALCPGTHEGLSAPSYQHKAAVYMKATKSKTSCPPHHSLPSLALQLLVWLPHSAALPLAPLLLHWALLCPLLDAAD